MSDHNQENLNYQMEQPGYHEFDAVKPQPAEPPVKRTKMKMGYGKKVLIALSLGLFFGIFAGLGFQAVSTATDYALTSFGKVQEVIINPVKEQDDSVIQEGAAVNSDISNDSITAYTDQLSQTSNVTAVVTDVTEVVREVMPSVVSVSNNYTERISYFGQEITSPGTSSGSGIIVGENDAELLIVSNYHVVSDAEELWVQFVDGSQAQAQLKGSDEGMDLAVISIPLTEIKNETLSQIKVAALGDSDSLQVGEPAIAIGNALGYGQSVTTGVISALDRMIGIMGTENDGDAPRFIQTDAAINPGNSGGALLNMQGQVIGINSNKLGGTAIEGMGYAIPISSAKPIIEELMQKETRLKVNADKRGYLGISGLTVPEDYVQTLDMPHGVYVSQVFEGSAAEAAGVVKGDVITHINNENITSMEELQKELEYYARGDRATLTIQQGTPSGYSEKKVEIILGDKIN